MTRSDRILIAFVLIIGSIGLWLVGILVLLAFKVI